MKKQLNFLACLVALSFLFGSSVHAKADFTDAPTIDQVIMSVDHFSDVTLGAEQVKLNQIQTSEKQNLVMNPQCTVLGLQVFNEAYAEALNGGASISDALDAANAAENFAVSLCEAIFAG